MSESPAFSDSELTAFRHQFSRSLSETKRRNEIYLANHSLGRCPDQAVADVQQFMEAWTVHLDQAWQIQFWGGEYENHRNRIADLLSIADKKWIIPKTNTAQGLRAVLNAHPSSMPLKIVALEKEFDSADQVLKAYQDAGRVQVTWVKPPLNQSGVPLYDASSVIESFPPQFDILIISHVLFETGQVLPDVGEIVAHARRCGAVVILDTYHSLGVIPVDFSGLDLDFAVGGCYKYLRGGPGACFLAVAERIVNDPRWVPLDTGWFAKPNPFSYERTENAAFAESGDRWLESTPPVITAYQAKAGLEFVLSAGVNRIRTDSLHRLNFLRQAGAKLGVKFFQPHDENCFGGFALLPSNQSHELASQLRQRGVNVDARGQFVRFSPDVLTPLEEINEAVTKVAHFQRQLNG